VSAGTVVSSSNEIDSICAAGTGPRTAAAGATATAPFKVVYQSLPSAPFQLPGEPPVVRPPLRPSFDPNTSTSTCPGRLASSPSDDFSTLTKPSGPPSHKPLPSSSWIAQTSLLGSPSLVVKERNRPSLKRSSPPPAVPIQIVPSASS
jgi:hypothetical protein